MAGERTSLERAPVARTPAVGMASSSRRVVPTLEALLGTTNIKPREWHHIDPEMWEDNVEAPDDEVGITTATTYIARAIADYTDRPTADEELFWEFRQDFEGWTEAMFLRAQPIYTKELKRILRFKGVYTGRINMAPSESLARLLRMEEYLEWPQDVFQSAVFDTRSAAHMLQERALRQQRSEGSVQSTDRRLSSQAQSRTQTPVRTRGRDVDSRQTRDQDQTHARVQGRQETVEEEQQIQDQLAKTIEKAQNQPIRSQPIETTESAPQPAYQRVQSQQPPLTYNNFDRFREYTPAYPRISMDSPPSPSITHRAEAIQKAMRALRKAAAEHAVSNALGTRNGPTTDGVLSLPLQSEVMVWREKNGWQGPYRVIDMKDHDVTVDMINGPTTFRSTVVKPYYRDLTTAIDGADQGTGGSPTTDEAIADEPPLPVPPAEATQAAQPRKRGRPPGSKNKPKVQYLSKKEEDDYALAVKLRNDGVINVPGAPFEASDQKEIDDLVGRGVFSFELFDPTLHGGYRIFKSRMVREVKGKTMVPYEKSRLVVQGYNDEGKHEILTQSPTIQRASQRLILALAPALLDEGMVVELRDITQAYPQAQTELFRTVLAHLPKELITKYPKGTIIRVIKPLYGIAEAGVHWFATYQGHHCKELDMATSTYDPCLLITNGRREAFGIVGLQTDDTLAIGTPAFSGAEDAALQKANFRAKPKERLSKEVSLEFNGCTLTLRGDTILLTQKGQGAKIEIIDPQRCQQASQAGLILIDCRSQTILWDVPLCTSLYILDLLVDISVDPKAANRAQKYMEQRARGAYIASICQPEASFDLSAAAQIQQPKDTEYVKLNRRLQWQSESIQRGLRYVPLDLATAKLVVFTDGSFANNQDLSSQLGYLLILANESSRQDSTFDIRGNVIHWSSTKCKRVTRSVLASETYGMVSGVDIAIAILTTLKIITGRLGLPPIPLIVCTDSYSLYECLVKLGTTAEKRLMIDIMALRQSYERREITEIRWINGEDNPADAFTKATPNRALERFIESNKLSIRVEGSVQRPTE
ncbi:conserved hypothetical protein [Pyrenophora tritici-repentis Pt-1C-BFP]|uniref:Reverse transcriptase Ty1/copia-type domain-containing protein n=1 Tax=Pyrenophora tritici-repentis (strain Pt-1C-BFP) TaxID=426418 RepID=B2WDR4_PYRTR|nr:uncharacterized protein PTRG_08123 [Pyrenophora tritici-repentis Pt-1C-BFP]EDU51042.1 conserved hypothetical protein [Pyrenophora tritici-repentis Pt-1C-BFP]